MHFSVAHDEIPRQIAICNDDYKFTVFSHSILQKFIVNEVKGIFHPEIVMTLHSQAYVFYRALRRIAFNICKLDIPWDLGISLTFREADSTLFATCVYLDLSSLTTDSSQKPASPLMPSVSLDAHLLISRPPPWLD